MRRGGLIYKIREANAMTFHWIITGLTGCTSICTIIEPTTIALNDSLTDCFGVRSVVSLPTEAKQWLVSKRNKF